MGSKDIEDSLERLDKLTQEEARMASVEQLKMAHNVDEKVMGVDDRVRGVERQVEDVGNKIQHVEDKVEDFREDLSSVERRARKNARNIEKDISSEARRVER